MNTYLEEYKQYLLLKGIRSYSEFLASVREYLLWCTDTCRTLEITLGDAEKYRHYLLTQKKNQSHGTINNKLSRLRSYYRFLEKSGIVMVNRFLEVEGMKKSKSIPKNILSIEEAGHLLSSFSLKNNYDIMLNVLVELLYGSGLRISEAARLRISDINFEGSSLRIFDRKANQYRKVPATEISIKRVREYVDGPAEVLVSAEDRAAGFLFPQKGATTLRARLNQKLLRECGRLGLKKITSHSFRHSAATHLLRKGAGIRKVQALLGHARIATTEVYTHVVKEDLKHVVALFHPREKDL